MSQQPIETQVVLSTDNSQYDRSMNQSADITNTLSGTVDHLSAKLKSLSQSAGRKMVGIAAADVATITAATLAYASFEKQMASLNAQAAVMNKNYELAQRQATAYGKTVNNLRSEFGTTTSQAVQLTQVISRMSDGSQSVDKLAASFTKMGNATGESATGLASSVLQLQRTMGTSQRDTTKYQNSLTTLAMGANTSATAIADFAQQIAPVGRLVGQSQADIQGVSSAFIKAGQDGYRAATVYNKVLTDISYATQSGSPELAKYANFVGMTVGHFKDLTGTEKIVSFFDQVNKLGPQAITSLNRMGLDGANTVKAITAVTQQTGGLGASIQQSRAAMNDNAIGRGNEAAMKGLTDDLAKLRQELQMTAESFGARFAPAAQAFVKGLEKMAQTARMVMDGPLGSLAAALAGIIAPLGALGGATLLAAPMLAKLAGVAFLTRGAGTMGLREGYRGAPMVVRDTSLPNQGEIGTRIATGGSWAQRYQYNALNRLGAGAAGAQEFARGMGFFGAPGRDPLYQRGIAGVGNAAAYGLRNIGAGMFSPLSFSGYRDPTSRPRFFNDPRSPIEQMRDRYRERTTGRAQGPSAGQRTMAPGVSLFDSDVRVTEEGRVTSSAATAAAASGMAARQAVTREASAMSMMFSNVTRAAGTMAGAMMSAAGNAAYLGGKAGVGLGAKLADTGPMLGMGALLGGSALGMSSNALTFGSTALMFGAGPVGVGLGTVAGVGLDVYQQNKDYNDAQKLYQNTIKSGTLTDQFVSGQGVIADRDKLRESTSGNMLNKYSFLSPVAGLYAGGGSISNAFSRAKYGAEGIFTGDNPILKREDAVERVQRRSQDTAGAYLAIASRQGQPINKFDFESEASWKQLDMVLASIQPKMDKLGVSSDDIVKAFTSSDTGKWGELLSQLADPDKYTGVTDRIAALGRVGAFFAQSPQIDRAVEHPDNLNTQYRAVNATLQGLSDAGKTTAEIVTEMGNIRATIKDPDNTRYQIAAGVQAQAQRQLGYQMPFMNRGQRFGAQADLFTAQRNVMAGDPTRAADMQGATDAMQASMAEQGDYFKNLLIQQREFSISQARAQEDFGITRDRMEEQYNLSRARSQQDFNIARKQQEHDYQLSRTRAETDFSITQNRSTQGFQRAQRRGQMDFNLSRKRQEEDYLHSITQMVEQQAKSMYSIYDRVRVESSSSANFLLFNAGDQLKRMQEQEQNLDTLRKAGVSDDTIQQLGLTDSANAQQLARFVAEVAGNPEMVAEFNKMVRKRLKAATELVKDESSNEWQEFQRQYKLARERAGDDFQRQVERSHRDFKRQMNQMEDDFRRSMNRQSEDYTTAQDRQQESFSRSMKRGAQDYAIAVDQMTEDFGKAMNRAQADMNRMGKEISGTLEEVLVKGTNKLGGTAAKQAGVVLKALRDLDQDSSKVGIQLMKHMSRVFGFDYQAPDINYAAGNTNGPGSNPHLPENHAAGGVLKGGRSVGSDNMTFYSPQHGVLNLAGGEAIMVPEWVDQVGGPNKVKEMNSKARRGYAGGGNIPAVGDWNQHTSGYPWARWAGDINVPGSGDYGNPVRAWKDGTVASVKHLTDSYGNHIRINHPKTEEQTLYAHLSKIMVNVLDQVARGQQIGNVGMSGNAFGPHLHFEIKGGTGPIDMGGTTASLKDILKDSYPQVEKDSAAVTMGGGLFPQGFWSKRINKYARTAWHQMTGTGKNQGADNYGDANSSNQEIVKAAMRSFGWNQWSPLYQLIMHESGFNNTAQNPTSSAYGMFQFLDSTWAGVGGHKTSDPSLQSLYGMKYIKSRYTDPAGAWKFWQGHNWYGDGAIFSGAQQIGVGERGPELALPLNNGGANFLADLFAKIYVGSEAKQTNVRYSQAPVGHTSTTYQIDRSTTFSGPISVHANNPNELISQLKARQRTYALAQQSLGGVRA